jgi:hypothetical protein
MNHPDRVRRHYHPCEIGDAPHRFVDVVKGQVLGHGFRDLNDWLKRNIGYQRVCLFCNRPAQELDTAEHLEDHWNTIEADRD